MLHEDDVQTPLSSIAETSGEIFFGTIFISPKDSGGVPWGHLSSSCGFKSRKQAQPIFRQKATQLLNTNHGFISTHFNFRTQWKCREE